MFAVTTVQHPSCVGLEGGCIECNRTMPRALHEQKFTFDMLDGFHLQRSAKGTPQGQKGEYTGVIIDSVRHSSAKKSANGEKGG